MATLDRITRDPAVMGGRPCIRGMRVTVGMIEGQIGSGVTIESLLADYPYLEREDVYRHCVTQPGSPRSGRSSSKRHEVHR